MRVNIQTTHVGSLPRPDYLVEANAKQESGSGDQGNFQDYLADAVRDVVDRQQKLGIDLVNDGEYGHSMGQRYNFRAWWSYVFGRLSGLELVDLDREPLTVPPPKPGELRRAGFSRRRDWQQFAAAYADPDSGCALPHGLSIRPVCRAPVAYVGRTEIERDVANFKTALEAAGLQSGYLNSVAPGSCARFGNEFYDSEEDLLYACADAMREEYTAIVEAGLTLQLDDPSLAENWDEIVPTPTVEEYRRFTRLRVEALNHAIRGLPPEQIRVHLCWGSWHGPHVTDIPMKDIVELMLEINASFYSFEAANARHEHEWTVWRDIRLP